MSRVIRIEPLTPQAFARFGQVLDTSGAPDKIINQGMCGRYHDRAQIDVSDGRAGISLFKAEARQFPIMLEMVERHPEGSQAFLPMSYDPFVVVVAGDEDGAPGRPRAFISAAGQGVNYNRGTWHGVLTPLHAPGLFAVVDRIGDGANLEEHWFDAPFTIENQD
ncbi:MAG: ureidoglycolate lyase [Roseobacter sp.]